MKRMAGIVFAFCLLASCQKKSQEPAITGSWQLTSIFIQTNGAGSWHAEDSIPPDFIRFNTDGTLTISAYVSKLYNAPGSYQVTSGHSLLFVYPNQANNAYGNNIVAYNLKDSILILTPPSMEYVQEKYIRIGQAGPDVVYPCMNCAL